MLYINKCNIDNKTFYVDITLCCKYYITYLSTTGFFAVADNICNYTIT